MIAFFIAAILLLPTDKLPEEKTAVQAQHHPGQTIHGKNPTKTHFKPHSRQIIQPPQHRSR